MATSELAVLISDRLAGQLSQISNGKLAFRYADAWLADPAAVPLSTSMPLASQQHADDAVRPFLWGLLPDNETTLTAWGRTFSASPRNPFALITHVGEDLQGAVQIVPPDRLASLRQREGMSRLGPDVLAARFLNLMRQPGATQFTIGGGQFSLAGAQPKKALTLVNGRWYEPRGRTPSTHILKPPMPHLPGQVENEVFCLQLAPLLSLPAPRTWVERFGELPVVVIERYDRVRMKGQRKLALDSAGGEVVRVHQEDMCQALKVMPQIKYQNQGGPGIAAIMKLLSGSAKPLEDRDRFMRAQAFNFIIGGTDAHGKNYGLLIGARGRFRLAPLYDINSFLPYLRTKKEGKLAMSVDRHDRLDQLQPRHWEAEARAAGYDAGRMLSHLRDIIARLPETSAALGDTFGTADLRSTELDQLIALLDRRCRDLSTVYGCEAM